MRTPSKCSSYLPFWKQPLSLRAYRHKPKISRKKKVIQTNKPPVPQHFPVKFLRCISLRPWRCRSTWQHLREPEKKKRKKLRDLFFPPSHGKLLTSGPETPGASASPGRLPAIRSIKKGFFPVFSVKADKMCPAILIL